MPDNTETTNLFPTAYTPLTLTRPDPFRDVKDRELTDLLKEITGAKRQSRDAARAKKGKMPEFKQATLNDPAHDAPVDTEIP